MRTIFLSAGHSATDPGAVANGYTEARLAVQLRDALAASLIRAGAQVQTDGAAGQNLPLRDACATASRNPNGINLELHFNAAGPAAAGVEVLASARHRGLAQRIAGAISAATATPLRGDRGYKPENAGQHHRLAFVQAGGLIVEVCFITNPNDLKAYLQRFAQVIQNLTDALCVAAEVSPIDWQAEAQFVNVAPAPPLTHAETFVPQQFAAPNHEWPQQPPWEPKPQSQSSMSVRSVLFGGDWLTSLAGYVGGLFTVLSEPTIKSAVTAAAIALLGRVARQSKD